LALPVVFVAGGLIYDIALTPEEHAALETKQIAERRAKHEELVMKRANKRSASEALRLSKAVYTTDSTGSALIISSDITNIGQKTYKDIVLTCTVFAETGTKLGQLHKTLYKRIEPGQKITVRNLNIGYTDSDWQKVICDVLYAATDA